MAMPSTYPAELVSIEGPDAIAFAQAQFSSNLASLADGQWQFSAWLDAQGRVKFLFHLMRLDEHRLRLLLRGGQAEALASQLQRYVFRSKVSLSFASGRPLGTGETMPSHAFEQQGDALVIGCGAHSLRVDAQGDGDWRLLELRAGWPWLPEPLSGELLPASLGLGELGATALDKGCYPGQEIVARLHYRGGNKRHLLRVRLSLAVPPGSVLDLQGCPSIPLLDVVPVDAAAEALAVVHEDGRASLASGIEAVQGGQPVFVQGI
jgi:folate-binding protein YgfZ